MGANDKKDTVLVLCQTFFHTAFRSEDFGGMNATKFRKFVQSRFIADFIIERGSEIPEGEYRVFTSMKIFDSFCEKLESVSRAPEVFEYINILKSLIHVVPTESINRLDEGGGIIVIADILANRSHFVPVVVTDRKPSLVEKAEEFYKKGKEEMKIPFTISNLEEIIPFLNGRYPEICNSVKERDKIFNIIL